jgi:hypothetical protein
MIINGIVGEEIRAVVIDHGIRDEVPVRRLVEMVAVDRYPGFEIDLEDRTMTVVEIRLGVFESG